MPKISSVMNYNLSLYGEGQRVGLIEDPRCLLYDTHEAFSAAPDITYHTGTSTYVQCTMNSNCASYCGDTPGVCLATKRTAVTGKKYCVDPHASQVASAFMASKPPDLWGAAKARLYHANAGSDPSELVACDPVDFADAYAWLDRNGVTTTINSSQACNYAGMTEDWYARNQEITVVRAAPNSDQDNTFLSCVSGSSLCVGGVKTNGTFFGAFVNFMVGQNVSDREEPDLVGFSGQTDGDPVEVLDVTGSTSAWATTGHGGNSYSAPQVAALAVLLKEYCGSTLGLDADQRMVRAILLASAWYFDPEDVAAGGLAFSTHPGPSNDYKDGAGGPSAQDVVRFCGEGEDDIDVGGTSIDIDLDGGGSAPPYLGESGGATPNSLDLGELAHPLGAGDDPSDWSVEEVRLELPANTRIRVAAVWDTCPATEYGASSTPIPVTVDLDLWLCKLPSGPCAAQSRTSADSKEGFDVTVSAAGDYQILVGWDPDDSYCGSETSEPVAIAWAYGPPGDFVEY